jgi:hypothetical protein
MLAGRTGHSRTAIPERRIEPGEAAVKPYLVGKPKAHTCLGQKLAYGQRMGANLADNAIGM